MDITQEKVGKLNSIVKVIIKPEDYQGRVEKAIKDHAKKAKLPGFRPGMVPPSHIKKMHGKSILVDEINTIINDSLNNYIKDNQIEIIGQPLPKEDDVKEFKWDYNDEFEFNYELGLVPEFNLEISSKDNVTHYTVKIDNETLASRITNLRKSYGKMSNPDVSAEDDVLYSELKQLSPDGSIFEEGISNTVSVRTDLIKDKKIKKSLTGLKAGDIVEFDIQKALDNDSFQVSKLLNITEEDAKALKSKFQLTVKNVNRIEDADLDQEFFDKIFKEKGLVKDEGEFKERIKEELETSTTQNAEQKLQTDLYKFVMEKINFQLPDEFLKRWLKATNENLSEEDLEKGYDDFAKNLKWTLVQNKILKENDIEIVKEEIFDIAAKRLEAQFRMYNQLPLSEDQLDQYTAQFLQNKENASRIFEEVKALKVLDYIKSVVTLEKKEIEYSRFLELG